MEPQAKRSKWLYNVRVRSFTPRQQQVIDLLLTGVRQRDIAAALNISQKTVHTHLALCCRKLGVKSVDSLVIMLVKQQAGVARVTPDT